MYEAGEVERADWLNMKASLRKPSLLKPLTAQLYGTAREAQIPGLDKRVVLLQLNRGVDKTFNLLVFGDTVPRPKRLKCFVGHRFSSHIEQQLRWNLRELFDIFGIDADYLGFDGAAVNLLSEVQQKISDADFCLFDNRETTSPSKPNVYIEAGMALALNKPFVFCHYRRDVWPSDFAGVLYLPYDDYRGLCSTLYSKLPTFLKRLQARPGRRSR
jgi:hypothetical protein